jgi:superfamily II DNA/RNA helicase
VTIEVAGNSNATASTVYNRVDDDDKWARCENPSDRAPNRRLCSSTASWVVLRLARFVEREGSTPQQLHGDKSQDERS